jgi:hypothetical protein
VRRWRAGAWCLAGLLAACGLLPPARAAEQAPALRATRIPDGSVLRMTGGLDDPAWQSAPALDSFWQVKPVDGRAAAVRTSVRVLYDAQALYFGVQAEDPDMAGLRAQLVRRDAVLDDQDYVGVFIDPIGAGKSALFVRVNAAGVVADGVYSADTNRLDFSPDFEIDALARQTAGGYTVELRVPLAALRFDAGSSGATWKLQVVRSYPRQVHQRFASVPLSGSAGSQIERMNPLQALELPARNSAWTLRPTLTVRSERRSADGQPAARKDRFEAGVDASWYTGGNWKWDATLKPDFSQVELDVPQLSSNVQFPLQLQEKRPFFLESSDILEAPSLMSEQGGGGLQALYSRSITQPSWGLRGSFRGDAREAVLLATRDKGGALSLLPGSYEASVVRQPASAIQLGRLRTHMDAASLGLIAINRQYEADAGGNAVLGADAVWRSEAGDRLRGIAMHSWTSAWAGDDGRLQRQAERQGSYVLLDWIRNAQTLEPSLSLQQASADYRNDTGFTAQSGFRQLTLQVQQKNALEGYWTEANPYISVVGSRDLQGATIQRLWAPGLFLHGPLDMQIIVEPHPRLLQRVRAGGVLHQLNQTYLEFRASPAAWFSKFTAKLTRGDLVDVADDVKRPGSAWLLEGQWRLAGRVELEARTEWTSLRGQGRRVLFDRADSAVLIYHFGPRNALRTIVQRQQTSRTSLAAGSAQTRQDSSLDVSLTYSHRLSSDSIAYLGASARRARDAVPLRERASELFGKWQFGF